MRRGLRWAALALVVVGSVELSARVAERLLEPVTPIENRELTPSGTEIEPGYEWLTTEVLHPYVGYVADRPAGTFRSHGIGHGPTPLARGRPATVNIVLVGGSVAADAADAIDSAFQRAFEAGSIRSRPRLLSLAYPGFKQPQQLNLVSWFLGLGARYDVVVNVDGFNEVALSIAENYANGVHPLFPRRWDQRVSRAPSRDRLREIGRITLLQDLRSRLEPGDAPLLSSTATGRLLARALQRGLRAQIETGRERLRRLPLRSDFESKGPFREYRRQDILRGAVVRHWARASRLLDHVVRGQGGEYHHVLQPNQYLEGSKPLTDAERATAYAPDESLSRAARETYPMLRARGESLGASGVRFHDATRIYSDVDETLYRDTCCHLNQRGNQILASFIVDRILATTSHPGLKSPVAPPSPK